MPRARSRGATSPEKTMIAARNERRLIGVKDRWGTPMRLKDLIRPCGDYIGKEGRLINYKGAYRIDTGEDNLDCVNSLLWHIGPKNYEVLR